jgi:hypothetical protein
MTSVETPIVATPTQDSKDEPWDDKRRDAYRCDADKIPKMSLGMTSVETPTQDVELSEEKHQDTIPHNNKNRRRASRRRHRTSN